MQSLIQVMVIFVFFSIINPVSAQSDPYEIVEKFFKSYETKGSSMALEELYATNLWMRKSEDAILKLKNQMEGLTEDFIGSYHGYEFITEKQASESFILLTYLVKFDRQPIRFSFQFYKPQDTWRVHSFQYDGNLGAELEESARIHYINYGM